MSPIDPLLQAAPSPRSTPHETFDASHDPRKKEDFLLHIITSVSSRRDNLSGGRGGGKADRTLASGGVVRPRHPTEFIDVDVLTMRFRAGKYMDRAGSSCQALCALGEPQGSKGTRVLRQNIDAPLHGTRHTVLSIWILLATPLPVDRAAVPFIRFFSILHSLKTISIKFISQIRLYRYLLKLFKDGKVGKYIKFFFFLIII